MRVFITAIFLFVSLSLIGQNNKFFAKAVDGFSKKKMSYFTLMDGSEVTGKIKKLKRKKWLFEKVIIIDENDKKREFEASEIKSMYLPQSSWDKLGKMSDMLTDATQWENTELNQEYIEDGYAYFESTEVYYKKKKKKILLLQLINPSFSGLAKVFYDPTADESTGIGIGGINVAGGGDKSFYIKIADEIAFKLKKKEYEDQVKNIFSECPDYLRKVKKWNWEKFGESLLDYTKTCNK